MKNSCGFVLTSDTRLTTSKLKIVQGKVKQVIKTGFAINFRY